MQNREISKQISFQISYLNIKLLIFKGHCSELEVFSFQAEFEKLHLKDTPTQMLPALALIKSFDDITEIWTRLHKAYGDPRVMLKNKLVYVKSIGPIWKLKDPQRLKEGLVNLTNAMSNLLKLSKTFGVEQKLYHGEAFDIIYSMMGETRVTKWFPSICDEGDLDESVKWTKLKSFLEKELRVQEEMSLIKKLDVSSESKEKIPPVQKDGGYSRKGYVAAHNGGDDDMKCSFCNEAGHVLLVRKGLNLFNTLLVKSLYL